jgi:transposase
MILQSKDPLITVKEIKAIMEERHSVVLSYSKIIKYLHKAGFRWRKLNPVSNYANTSTNIKKRSAFARRMIEVLE